MTNLQKKFPPATSSKWANFDLEKKIRARARIFFAEEKHDLYAKNTNRA